MLYAVVMKTISFQAYTSLSWFLFVFKASCLMHMVTTWVWAFSITVNLLVVFPVLALWALSLQPTGVAFGALFLLCDPVPLARFPCPRVMPSSISFISSSEGLDLREKLLGAECCAEALYRERKTHVRLGCSVPSVLDSTGYSIFPKYSTLSPAPSAGCNWFTF